MGGPATLCGSITLALWLQDAKANLGRQTVPAQAAQFPGATGSDGAAPGLDTDQPGAGPIPDRGRGIARFEKHALRADHGRETGQRGDVSGITARHDAIIATGHSRRTRPENRARDFAQRRGQPDGQHA
ncbi:hypothetical protein E4T56_gene41 [Termitomyces sp. T112]|nr:hypothetical protein E4T56_gene41 [Termitomyces sp. T112]